jgi:molybdopterin converting factor subunit 1
VKVRVLYFAAVRDLARTDEEEIEIAADVRTIGALAVALAARHPALEGRLGPVRFARNEEFARLEDPIADGDVVALIPPVAGG